MIRGASLQFVSEGRQQPGLSQSVTALTATVPQCPTWWMDDELSTFLLLKGLFQLLPMLQGGFLEPPLELACLVACIGFFFFIINPQTLPNQPQKQSQVENYPDIQFENRELTGVCVGQLYFLNLSSSFPFSCSLRPARLTRFLIQFVLAALKTGHQRNL